MLDAYSSMWCWSWRYMLKISMIYCFNQNLLFWDSCCTPDVKLIRQCDFYVNMIMEVSTGNSNQSIVYLDASSTMAEFIAAQLCCFSLFLMEWFCIYFSLNILFFWANPRFYFSWRRLCLTGSHWGCWELSVTMPSGVVVTSLLVWHWDYWINTQICGLVSGTVALTSIAYWYLIIFICHYCHTGAGGVKSWARSKLKAQQKAKHFTLLRLNLALVCHQKTVSPPLVAHVSSWLW